MGTPASYLYGDATTCPVRYDVLATVQLLIDCAQHLGAADREIKQLRHDTSRRSQHWDRVAQEIERMRGDVLGLIARRAEQAKEDLAAQTLSLLDVVRENLKQAEAHQRSAQSQDAAKTTAKTQDQRGKAWAALNAFLTSAPLPSERNAFFMKTDGEAVALRSEHELEGGVAVSFDLNPGATQQFGSAPTVARFVEQLDIKVGFRKRFLRRALVPVREVLDEFTIVGLSLRDDDVELRLHRESRRKVDQLVLTLAQNAGTLSGLVQRNPDTEQMETHSIDPDDLPRLQVLVDALVVAAQGAFAHKHRVRWAKLDGSDVANEDLGIDLLHRILSNAQPVLREIANRSASPSELTLKIDRGEGRREELYLRKAELQQHLDAMPMEVRRRFAIPELVDAAPKDRDEVIELTQIHTQIDSQLNDLMALEAPPKKRVPQTSAPVPKTHADDTEDISLGDIEIEDFAPPPEHIDPESDVSETLTLDDLLDHDTVVMLRKYQP